MSTNRGSSKRTRPQKYQNSTAFKNDLHDKTPKIKLLNSLQISEVCDKCKSIIEWKIKYKTYKPLKQPKTCIQCHRKAVRMNYHSLCPECAKKKGVCAKCLRSAEEVPINPPQPDEKDQQKLRAEMQTLLKAMSERKRRSFMRFMDKGKELKVNIENSNGSKEEDVIPCSYPATERTIQRMSRVPYTRLELVSKIAELTAAAEDFIFDDTDDDNESDESGDADTDTETELPTDVSSISDESNEGEVEYLFSPSSDPKTDAE